MPLSGSFAISDFRNRPIVTLEIFASLTVSSGEYAIFFAK
jgi:hypothetical protein